MERLRAGFLGMLWLGLVWCKKGAQMLLDGLSCFDRKTRGERIQIGIGIDLRRVEVQLLAPYQLRLLTLFDDGFKEASKHLQTVAPANLDFGSNDRATARLNHTPDTSAHSADLRLGA